MMESPIALPTFVEVPAASCRTGMLANAIPILAGLVLLTAATLKAHQLFAGRGVVLDSILPYQQFIPFLIQAELLLGLWLLLGAHTRIRSICATACFSLFAIVATYEALHALPSCGCFGNVKVPPAITAGFDLFAVVGLWLTRPRKGALPPSHRLSRVRLAGGVALAVAASGVLWTLYFLKIPPAMAGEGGAASGGLVILEPADWLNKSFPLFDSIDGSDALRHGRWLVVIYHHDCHTCRQAIPNYQSLAMEANAGTDRARPRVAFIAMPPLAAPGEDPVTPSSAYLHLSLRPDHEWFATTPVVAALEEGRVLRAVEGEQAVQPPDVPQWR